MRRPLIWILAGAAVVAVVIAAVALLGDDDGSGDPELAGALRDSATCEQVQIGA